MMETSACQLQKAENEIIMIVYKHKRIDIRMTERQYCKLHDCIDTLFIENNERKTLEDTFKL